MRKITGAIFDMDGTLTDSMFIWGECYQEVLWQYFHATYADLDKLTAEKMDTAPISIGAPMLCEYFHADIDPDEVMQMMRPSPLPKWCGLH